MWINLYCNQRNNWKEDKATARGGVEVVSNKDKCQNNAFHAITKVNL